MDSRQFEDRFSASGDHLAGMTQQEEAVLSAGVAGLADLYRDRRSDPVSVTTAYLQRIARYNRSLGAFVTVDLPRAKTAANASRERWRAGRPLSPLDGVPIAIKANIAVAGLPLSAGIAAYAECVADIDAASVAHLRAAGAVILGLTNMDEGALGARGDNALLGRCHNPHRHGFSPGGSSGGSAVAVAAGLCASALGTDTIGSVRIPAAYCGIFGHKPRQAMIDRRGIVPLSPRFDHVGVLARSADDCAAMLDIMADHRDVRLAVLDPEMFSTIMSAISRAIADVAANAIPVRLEFDFALIRRMLLTVAEVEGAGVHAAMLRDRPEGFSANLAKLLRWGQGEGQSHYGAALAGIADARSSAEAALADVDALLLPATGHPAFAHDMPAPADQANFMTLATVLGWPATVFPIGTCDRLPIGAQVIARDDAACLSVARALSRPVALHLPPARRR